MSPAPSEIIRRIQQKEAARDAEQRRQQVEQEKREKEEEKRRGEEQRRTENENQQRLELKRRQVQEIFTRSGVISGLQDIEKSALSGISKHDIVVNYDKGTALLVWGNKYRIEDGEVLYEKADFFTILLFKHSENSNFLGEIDCSLIQVTADVDTGALRVDHVNERGYSDYREIIESERRSNPDVVNEALAIAYMHPLRYRHEEWQKRYSSSDTTNTECCNS